MAELKRNFSGAAMNKDMDERLVPEGQYRDAQNIQVVTSDGSNVGAAQNIRGNAQRNTMYYEGSTNNSNYGVPDNSWCVGSIALPEKDKIYYLVAAGINSTTGVAQTVQKDYIVEYDVISQKTKFVFVDIYRSANTVHATVTNAKNFLLGTNQGGSTTINKTGIRIGMQVVSTTGAYPTLDDNVIVKDIYYSSGDSRWKINTNVNVTLSGGASIAFISDRVLNFNKDNFITGINVIDNLLFWTDNNYEPKRINIERSIKGTGGTEYLYGANNVGTGWNSATTTNTYTTFIGDTDYFHTRLVTDSDNDGNLQVVTSTDKKKAVWSEEKHITVIRKAPTQPLELEMSRTKNPRINSSGVENDNWAFANSVNPFYDSNNVLLEAGDTVDITFQNPVDFRVDDVLILTNELSDGSLGSTFEKYEVRAVVDSGGTNDVDNPSVGPYTLRLLSVDQSLPDQADTWYARIEDGDPLFEFKFVRFSYRYKYQDGEYSTFAPWSQPAFLPGPYEYFPKKGYNLGMRNHLRNLKIKGYHAELDALPRDAVEIDILYKEVGNNSVYLVKTIKPTDAHPLWPDLVNYSTARGEYEIKTDLIHSILPSNQLLRPWDNVPRKALAQEITSNRLIYGNYLQNYTVVEDPIIELSLKQNNINPEIDNYALPSVKSLRTYQVGVVFGDEYGRETPVLTSKNASITVPKLACETRNRIFAKLGLDTVVPAWAKYFSYYIKETSSEYYTMAMDRWYNAADGNIWLSFPSSERNKIDEETFLILKKAHGSDTAVTDKARYKILAIENEAPDYIKTEKKNLGTFEDVHAQELIGNSTRGYPLQDSVYITVEKTAFTGVFGEDFGLKTIDNLYIVFRGQQQKSKEYEVTQVSFLTNIVKLSLKHKIGEDASFISSDDTYANRITDLKFDLIEHEVENNPEFDGRFFVKIFKDEMLEKYIILPSQSGESYRIKERLPLRYLNNNGYANTPASGIPSINARQSLRGENSIDWNDSTNGNAHPTEYSHHGSYVWNNSGDIPASADGGTTPMSIESVGLLNDDTLAAIATTAFTTPVAREFWAWMAGQQSFFIDACTAYQWTGHLQHVPGDEQNETGANHPDSRKWQGGFKGGGTMPNAEEGWESSWSSPPSGKWSNSKKGKGLPSRGIWGNGEFIDISWTGMDLDKPYTFNTGGWGKYDDDGPYPARLSEFSTGYHAAHNLLIQHLVQPGTRFRFEANPDETVYTVVDAMNQTYPSKNYNTGTTKEDGAWGIRNYRTAGTVGDKEDRKLYEGACFRQRWTIKISPAIGTVGPNFYNPITGTPQITDASGNTINVPTPVRALKHDATDKTNIELLEIDLDPDSDSGNFSNNPAIWETEPKETADLDIYHQATGLIPLRLTEGTDEEYIPIGSTFKSTNATTSEKTVHTITSIDAHSTSSNYFTAQFTPAIPTGSVVMAVNSDVFLTKRNYYSFSARVAVATSDGDTSISVHGGANGGFHWLKMFRRYQVLDWNNCWAFGNGVESDRIRDDFNAPQMDNGVKASTVLAEPVKEERRKHGLIWSGLYNSTTGINETNQFLAAEKITKDLNPTHGSIQKLYAKNTNLVALCEDKTLRIHAKKDALYNADGESNITSSAEVLGAAQAYKGD